MSKTSWIKTVLFFLVAMLLIVVAVVAAPYVVVPVEDAYVVVPVEDWPELTYQRAWGNNVPPDAEILQGVAPVFVAALSCEQQGCSVLCEGTLVIEGGIEVGTVQLLIRDEMLPVIERWTRNGVVMLPTVNR